MTVIRVQDAAQAKSRFKVKVLNPRDHGECPNSPITD